MPKIETIPQQCFITYNIKEIKLLFPDVYNKLLSKHEQSEQDISFQMEEAIDSYKAICEALNISLSDYSMSVYYHSYVKFKDYEDESRLDLDGVRAYKFFINRFNLFTEFKWIPVSRIDKNSDYYRSRKAGYRKPWKSIDCPFTGVCYDDILMEYILKDALSGSSVKECLNNAWEELQSILEKEYEYLQSEEEFLQQYSDERFLESGKIY